MKNNLLNKISVSFLVFVLIMGTMIMTNVNAAYTITINGGAGHTYEAYQVFKGVVSTDGKTLSNITWGSNVDQQKLLEALKADKTFGEGASNDFYGINYSEDTSASKVAQVLDDVGDNSDKAKAFAQCVASALKENPVATTTVGSLSVTDAGYYFIKDKDETQGGANDTYTRYILKIVFDVEVSPKTSGVPTVDKYFAGNKEVSEHAMYENFPVYLKATLSAANEYAEYPNYKLVFEDTMGAGMSYDNTSVVVTVTATKNNEAVASEPFTLTTADYSTSLETKSLTVTVTDLVSTLKKGGYDITKGVDVIVTYNAYLNNNATVTLPGTNQTLNAQTTTTTGEEPGETITTIGNNTNKVVLKYTNDPNSSTKNTGDNAMGIAVSDNVYVFTYGVNNTKTFSDQAQLTEGLPQAGFTLYKGSVASENEVRLYYDSTLGAYRPATTGETTVTEMTSDSKTGKFDIKGLAPGTYILRETDTPDGYNTCKDITISVTTNGGIEVEDGLSATVTFTNSEPNMINTIENVHGANLPSTGAMALVVISIAAALLGVSGMMLSKEEKED